MSEGFPDERFQRLEEKFTNPLLEPNLLFLSSTFPLFTHFNQLLQREDPTIHILNSSIEGPGKKVAKRLCFQLKLEMFPEQGRKKKNKYVPLFIQNFIVKKLKIWENLFT